MKSIIIISLALILIFTAGYLMTDYINKTSEAIDTELTRLDNEVRLNKWNSANKILNIMESSWNNTKNTWALLVDHQEIDNINLCISKMKEYIKGKDPVDALAEISSLKLLFEHIPQKDSLTWTNIL
ncbi:MAG: DUF4363 family protein [Deltaproteobacteria bacterium]